MIWLIWPLLLFFVSPISSLASPLHDAAKSGDISAVEQFIGKGVDINVKGKNDACPLIVAALEGQMAVANLLITRDADVHARNKAGLTALHAAAYKGHADIAELLIAKGADINNQQNRFGITPLHIYCV